MITLNSKTAIETGSEVIYKSQELTVNYQAVLETELIDGVPTKVGKIKSWLFNEIGINIMGVQRVDNDKDFLGKDILGELHKIYIAELRALNPTLTFTDTYNK
jgi:hypothetical protein